MKRAVTLAVVLGLGLMASARPATGDAVPELAAFDEEVQALMARWGLPGASLAVGRRGALVLARGYGTADAAGAVPVQPDTLFRLASVSKTVTALAVMKLVEDGALTLDLAVFPYLARGTPSDSRVNQITVRHLLEHSGGWDSHAAGDPMVQGASIAQAMRVPSPPSDDTILRYMLTQPLQFVPGTKSVESNFGYLVLGVVVERASGQTLQAYTRSVLLRAGITRMLPARSFAADRSIAEASYLTEPGWTVPSVFATVPGRVPWPDGGFALESATATLGWVGSAIDLVALAAALDGDATRADALSATSQTTMAARSSFATSASRWWAKGWQVNSSGTWWQTGAMPGTGALLVRASDGTQWAFLSNLRPANAEAFIADLDATLWRAYGAVSTWPAVDQFPSLHSSGPINGCFGDPLFSGGTLCIPAVDVVAGDGTRQRFTASFVRVSDPGFLTVQLSAADVADNASDNVAVYEGGTITLPRVVVTDLSGRPTAYSATLGMVPGTDPPRFRLTRSAVLK